MIRVEVVTPVHNRKEITLQCLRSLSRIKKDSFVVHIIVVDDGSTDGTPDSIGNEFPEVEIIEGSGNLWYTEGTNVGFRSALRHNPDYILAINDDTIFEANFLQILVEAAEKNPGAIVAPVLLLWDSPHKVFQTSPLWNTWEGGLMHFCQQTVWSIPDQPWEVAQIVGNCVLYPADAVRKGGLMDSRRFKMLGDAEYTPRLKRKGWKLLIEPRARVFCKPNDVPTGFRKMPVAKMFSEAFLNPYGPYSVRRRIHITFANAPTPFHALLALPIFYFRAIVGINAEGTWGQSRKEMPLKEMLRTL